ncbi:hypothetical protein BGZ57DRAFT_555885 [Hyaloscypha finlandica]|nr:hypothetical protein BGZ57DRAFT_555885 [Hyaloscypha finlandica]KAH8800103.1 hypothetical protein F5882DRAFT_348240 [Hyaloscypha sp. PMI_1271]
MTSVALVGATGLVGSQILSTLLSHASITSVHSLSRRQPTNTSPKLQPLLSTETSQWSTQLSSITPQPSIFFSALGTTRGAAGSFEAQRKIDYDLNLALAQAAKASGVKVYVLISTGGANPNSMMGYPKMKGELEEAIKALDFEHTIILRPGLLVGERQESRPAEFVVRQIAGFAGALSNGLKDFWAQDGEVVGRAAVSAGLEALEGKGPKVWLVGQPDIVRLGRTEWEA